MKKVFPCIFLLLFLFSGCTNSKTLPQIGNTEKIEFSSGYIFESTTTKHYGILSCDNNSGAEDNSSKGEELRGVWLSYYELDVDNSRNNREKYASYITSLCESYKTFGITDVFVHVRAYADAIYTSTVYPTSVYAGVQQGEELKFDLLEVICEVMQGYGIKVHAWINPYRVHNGTDISELSENNKARQWYREDSNEDVAVVAGKIYFNPSSRKAQQLVVEGAREILLNYPVAGIHIDDYFYPPDCGDFDSAEYKKYLSSGGTLSLSDWRRENVNNLVRSLYTAVKTFGDDKIFSVSPAGNIQNNYNELYADVALWCAGGYADMIIPQIYFGFEHGTHPFEKCLSDWYALKSEGVKMPVGLGIYKSGTSDSFAAKGEAEWQQSTDIIKRQVQLLRSRGCDGFAVFSSDYLVTADSTARTESENLKAYLNADT